MNAEPTPCGETKDPPYSVAVAVGASHNDEGQDLAVFPVWLPPESFLDELLRASAVADDASTLLDGTAVDAVVGGIALHAEHSLDDDDISLRRGTVRVCLQDGCLRYAQMNQLCYRHGGRRTCQIEGCGKKDRGNGRCVRHGGGEQCIAPGCTRHARARHYCYRHRAFAHDD